MKTPPDRTTSALTRGDGVYLLSCQNQAGVHDPAGHQLDTAEISEESILTLQEGGTNVEAPMPPTGPAA